MKHQMPDWTERISHHEILPSLFIAGEDEIDELLYGKEEARRSYQTEEAPSAPDPQIDVWLDVRDLRASNRQVVIPENVEWLQLPFRDGNVEEAEEVLPRALALCQKAWNEEKRLLITCHQGRSRSFLIMVRFLQELGYSYLDAYWMVKGKRCFVQEDKAFTDLLRKISIKDAESWVSSYILEEPII